MERGEYMRKHIWAAVMAAIFSTTVSSIYVQAESTYLTDNVVVRAENARARAKKRPETVTIITKQDMKEKKMQDLRNVLEVVPGVSFSVDGMNRSDYSIRGAASRHCPIFVDGLKEAGEYSKLMGAANEMERFSTHNMARVEVVRGVSGARYGSDAVGGAIRIVTKRPVKTNAYFDYEYRVVAHDKNDEYTYRLGMDMVGKRMQAQVSVADNTTAPYYNWQYADYNLPYITDENFPDFKTMDTAKWPKNHTFIQDNFSGSRRHLEGRVFFQPTSRTEVMYGFHRLNDDTRTSEFLGRYSFEWWARHDFPEELTEKNKGFFYTEYMDIANHIQRDTNQGYISYGWNTGDIKLRVKDSHYGKLTNTYLNTTFLKNKLSDWLESGDRSYDMELNWYGNPKHSITVTAQRKKSYGIGTRMRTPNKAGSFEYHYWEYNAWGHGDGIWETTKEKQLYRADMEEWNAAITDTYTPNDKITIVPTLRYTHHTTGHRPTVGLGIIYKNDDRTKIKVNVGTGFSTPGMMEMYHHFMMKPFTPITEDGVVTDCYQDFKDKNGNSQRLYFYPGWYFQGNPALIPEKALGFDISLEKEYTHGQGRLTAFYNHITDYLNLYYTLKKLETDPDDPDTQLNDTRIYSYSNLKRVTLAGVEAEYTHRFDKHWSLTASATYLHAVDDSTGKRLTMKPLWKYIYSLNYKNKAWHGTLWGEYNTNYIDIFDRKHIKFERIEEGYEKNYGIANLLIERQVTPSLSYYFGVNNLFHYQSPSLNIRGRIFRIGGSLQF